MNMTMYHLCPLAYSWSAKNQRLYGRHVSTTFTGMQATDTNSWAEHDSEIFLLGGKFFYKSKISSKKKNS